jgi:hypothetical protein
MRRISRFKTPCSERRSPVRVARAGSECNHAQVVSQWAKGAPVKSFWTGTKVPDQGRLPIGTYRCSSCGYLEAYARHEFFAK